MTANSTAVQYSDTLDKNTMTADETRYTLERETNPWRPDLSINGQSILIGD